MEIRTSASGEFQGFASATTACIELCDVEVDLMVSAAQQIPGNDSSSHLHVCCRYM